MSDTSFRLQRPTYDELTLPGEDERFDMPGTAGEFLDLTYKVMGGLMQRLSRDGGYHVIGDAEIEPGERTIAAFSHVSNLDTPLGALILRAMQTGQLNSERQIPGFANDFTNIEALDRPRQKDPVAIGKIGLFSSPLLAEFFATGSVPAQRGEKPKPDYEQSRLLDQLYRLDNFAAEMLYSYIRLHPGEGKQRMQKLRQVIREARGFDRKPFLNPEKNSADYNLPVVDLRTTLEFGEAVLDSGRPLLIFPQGKRKAPGSVPAIESGVALFAQDAKVIPIGHDGTHLMGLRHKVYDADGEAVSKQRTKKNQRGPVVVAIGEPIDGPQNRKERKGNLCVLCDFADHQLVLQLLPLRDPVGSF